MHERGLAEALRIESQPMTAAAVPLHPRPAVRALAARFFGYLSADGLNYALGFLIYGWLVRVLTNQQYGQLSIATSVYQALMMVAALGLDLTGPKLISDFGGDPMLFARRAQHLRLAAALLVCGPLQVGGALYAWHRGQNLLAVVILASFSMVLARALDLTYLAVALRAPAPLAKTRALGLSVYLVILILCTPLVREHLWLVPVLNAVGVTIGRLRLGRLLRLHAPTSHAVARVGSAEIMAQGIKAGGGQLLLLILQTGDVILLAKYVSVGAVGQYAMISRLYLLGLAVLGAMFNTFLPEVIQVTHQADKLRHLFRTCLWANLGLGLLGAAVFYGMGAPLAELLAHRPLSAVRAISPIFAVVFLLMSVANPFLSLLPSLHRGTEYFVGVASAAALLLALDLALMTRYGAVGAAYGQAMATAYLALFSILVYLRHVRALHAKNLEAAARDLIGSSWQV